MRGGTARCTVIVSDEEIGSPLTRNPDAVIALNLPSLDKYESLVKQNGIMIANSSLINREMERADVQAIYIPAAEMAEEIGNPRLANMLMLGALLAVEPILPLETVEKALGEHIPERHKKTLPMNFKAMELGAEFVRNVMAQKK